MYNKIILEKQEKHGNGYADIAMFRLINNLLQGIFLYVNIGIIKICPEEGY